MSEKLKINHYDLKNLPEFITLENKKINERALNSKSKMTLKVIDIVSSLDYKLYTHKNNFLIHDGYIFTLIILVYDTNLKYIQECLFSALDQSYKNTEIILINNGAKGIVKDFALNIFFEHKNIKYIETKDNLFNINCTSFTDPIVSLHNAGLFCSEGDFVYWLSYDDKINKNYVNSMINLFKANVNCKTAAPQVQFIDEDSNFEEDNSLYLKKRNIRKKFENGSELLKSYMKNENKILFPGQILAVRTQTILDNGCFDIDIDKSQLYKFAIQSDSGFDPEAILFWRHHSAQVNKKRSQAGIIAANYQMEFYFQAEIENFHREKIGAEFAQEFKAYYIKSVESSIKNCIVNSFQFGGITGGLKCFINLLKIKPIQLIFYNLHSYFYNLFKNIFIFSSINLIKKFRLTNRCYFYLKQKLIKSKFQ